jgi:hypothetical protein
MVVLPVGREIIAQSPGQQARAAGAANRQDPRPSFTGGAEGSTLLPVAPSRAAAIARARQITPAEISLRDNP